MTLCRCTFVCASSVVRVVGRYRAYESSRCGSAVSVICRGHVYENHTLSPSRPGLSITLENTCRQNGISCCRCHRPNGCGEKIPKPENQQHPDCRTTMFSGFGSALLSQEERDSPRCTWMQKHVHFNGTTNLSQRGWNLGRPAMQ